MRKAGSRQCDSPDEGVLAYGVRSSGPGIFRWFEVKDAMNKEILTMVDILSNEKGVSKEIIFAAIEDALVSATKKRTREDIEARVAIDRETGDYETFRCWEVVDDAEVDSVLEAPDRQVLLSVARQQDPEVSVGASVEEPMPSVQYGRIAASTARQVILQKVRDAERARMVEVYKDRVGEMLGGIVKRVERNGVGIDLGNNVDGFIARDHLLPREQIRTGDRVRAWLFRVEPALKGPQLFLSRTAPELLTELFKIEVPEINEGLIEIIDAARDPGNRAKIAVRAVDQRVDPIGACVGMRGSRVQAVSNELDGERVEIVLWNEDVARYVVNAMAPAEVSAVLVDEEQRQVDVVVEQDAVAKAKGREGQNVRLASRLTGWQLTVLSEQQVGEKTDAEAQKLHAMFMERLGADEEVATILVQEGYTSIEEVAYVPEKEMLQIEEFDNVLVSALRGRANDVLLTQAIADEEYLDAKRPAADLLGMEGVDASLAWRLARKGIQTMEDLADQSTEELVEISGMEAEQAAALILAARQPWFNEVQAAETRE